MKLFLWSLAVIWWGFYTGLFWWISEKLLDPRDVTETGSLSWWIMATVSTIWFVWLVMLFVFWPF